MFLHPPQNILLRTHIKHPTARIVSQLRGKADDRAEASAGGLCRTSLVAAVVVAPQLLTQPHKETL